jgi:NDP-4-keto-2,6-dideoxyhexose 3-C-methyltransferase
MKKCINCKKKGLLKIVELGKQPLSGIFLSKKKENLKKYSLDLFKCKKCDLVQLGESAKLEKMFGHSYEYSTALSKLMVNHIKDKVEFLKKKKIVRNNSNILDIGSNDGTFLNQFQKTNYLVGIDPSAEKFKKNYKRNIKTIFNFFSKKNLKGEKNKFDLVTSFAMFYDVSEPGKFCSDIFDILKKNGIWLLELSYLPLMLKNLTYDQICHEHIAYYSLTSFKKVANKNGIKILDFKFNEINGGSIEILCARNDSDRKVKVKKIKNLLVEEKKINLQAFLNFNKRIKKVKSLLQMFLKLNSKKNIIAYGASTKGNVVLNHCNVSNKQIQEICDGSRKKINKFTPGSNIKIISKPSMRKKKPDYLIVLIWSFRKEVIQQELKYIKSGGRLVFLLPRFHLVNKENYKYYLKQNFNELSYQY